MKRIFVTVLFLLLNFVLFTSTAWAVLTQTQVSQLYIGVFGRASEGDGSSYWQTDPSSTSMTAVADVMLNTEPAQTYFGSTLNDNKAFIEHIYLNTLGKTYSEDSGGIDYWIGELSAGKTKGEVIEALIVAAQNSVNAGAAQDQFNNKVEVSNYCADTIAVCSDIDAFTGFVSGVTADATTVTSAKATINTANTGGDTGPDPSDKVAFAKAMVPGAWTTTSVKPSLPSPYISVTALIMCPGGKLKGVEHWSNGYDAVMKGSWDAVENPVAANADYPAVDMDYTSTIGSGGQTDTDTGILGKNLGSVLYNSSNWESNQDNIVYLYNNAWFYMTRVKDGDADSMDDSSCSDSSSSSNECGADSDCGRCFYCDKSSTGNKCRYGGEGPYGCYRGWDPY